MDLSADSGTLPTNTATGELGFEHELSLSYALKQTDGGRTISLQVLEFKTSLLEAVEELHIRRDAEARYEEQINKLVLEKQEIEWQKESLQRQIDTMANQQAESLSTVKKQFQSKVRAVEEEKGKHQLIAELKEKEITSLKEELKLLQLSKYSLEKKLSELEQKFSLQSQSKDSHLNQLGEVEKRFGALSRQCALVKQAHDKLEQNVDEAMKVNKKLSSVNRKQEMTISSLKQEVEELNKKLIQSKVSSVSRSEDTNAHAAKEQHIQQIHQKLIMEIEMNKKLMDENAAERTEKQEIMSSLQHAQKLLLYHTQAVNRMELELQTHREEYQALKREHEVMQEKSKTTDSRMARLMEEYTNSRTIWEKEKVMLLEHIKNEQQELKTVSEAYEELKHRHCQVSSQTTLKTHHMHSLDIQTTHTKGGLESRSTANRESSNESIFKLMDIPVEDSVTVDRDQTDGADYDMECTEKDQRGIIWVSMDRASLGPSESSSSLIISDPIQSHKHPSSLCSLSERNGGQGPLGESSPISELWRLGRLQDLAPSQTRDSDCLVVTESMEKQATTGAKGGQDDHNDSNNQQPPEPLETFTPKSLPTTPLVADPLLGHPAISGATGGQTDSLHTQRSDLNMTEKDPASVTCLTDNACTSDQGLLCGEGSSVAAVSVSASENRSVYRATHVTAAPLVKGDSAGERGGGEDSEEGGKEEKGEEEGRRDCKGIEKGDGKEDEHLAEERGRGTTDTADTTERERDKEEVREHETKRWGIEKRDGTQEEWRNGAGDGRLDGEDGGRRVLCTAETDTPTQTSADNKPRDRETCKELEGTDPLGNTKYPLAASLPSYVSLTPSQKVTEKDADASLTKEGPGLIPDEDKLKILHPGPQTRTCTLQPLIHAVAPALIHGTDTSNSVQQVSENTMEKATVPQSMDLSCLPSQDLAIAQSTFPTINPKDPEHADASPNTTTSPTINEKEKCDPPVKESTPVTEKVKPVTLNQCQLQESVTQEIEVTKSLKADSSTCGKGNFKPTVILSGNDASDVTEQLMAEANMKDPTAFLDACVHITVENVGPVGSQSVPSIVGSALSEKHRHVAAGNSNPREMNGNQQHLENAKQQDAKVISNENILGTSETDSLPDSSSSLKCTDECPADEKLFGDIDYSVLSSNKTYRSSFEWASAQRKKVDSRATHPTSHSSKPKPKRSPGFPESSSPFSIPAFLKGTQCNRGLPSPTITDQRGEWKAIRDTISETTTADMEGPPPVSVSSPPVSTLPSTVNRMPWQAALGSAKTSAISPCPASGCGFECFPPGSQEMEEHQTSFKAQIDKIEHFLSSERLRLPKRKRTENN